MLGKLLQGRYQVVQVLGAGGFCHTYLAQDTHYSDSPTCVVKHLKPFSNHPDSLPTLRKLFTKEAKALKKLGNHDQVPQLLDHFEDNLEFYLVQEFIAGHPLSTELLPGQRWSESQVVQLLQEVLQVLEFVHRHGLIHRDIKPSNLIRRELDNRLVLIDFGSSVKQAWTQVVTAQGQTNATFAIGIPATIAIGTPGYMPTEQGRGRPRLNSDIYALGMIGIQALTGLYPRQLLEDVDSGELIWQHQAQVSPLLASILNKMVCYHFKDRYQCALEVMQALQLLAKLYPPTQEETDSSAPHLEGVAATPTPQVIPGEQHTIPFFWSNLSKPQVGDKTSDASVLTTSGKSALLIGLSTGFVSALVLIVSSYYVLQLPAPASKIQSYSVPSSSKNTYGNITLANTLTGHSDVVWSVALSPDGQTLVSSSGDQTIKLWNLQTGKLLRTLSGHSGTVWSIAISSDGQTLASGSSDNTIKIWKLGTGELLQTLFGHTDRVISVTLSPDGKLLASGSVDKTIKIWNLSSRKLKSTLSGHSDWVNSIAISPDGQTLASGIGDTIKIWDLNTGSLLHRLPRHSSGVSSVCFSANGKRLVSGSGDKTIKIWRL